MKILRNQIPDEYQRWVERSRKAAEERKRAEDREMTRWQNLYGKTPAHHPRPFLP